VSVQIVEAGDLVSVIVGVADDDPSGAVEIFDVAVAIPDTEGNLAPIGHYLKFKDAEFVVDLQDL
jgi:hypothetical protein